MISLVSASALLADAGSYTIVDARRAHEYHAGHIPGSVLVSWEDLCEPAPSGTDPILQQPGWWGILRTPGDMVEHFAARGISDDQPIVVYADGIASFGRDGRIAWILLYMGARSVYLLDGGWQVWLRAGGGSEEQSRPVRRGQFTAAIQHRRRALLPDIIAGYQSGKPPLLVDTRSQEEYDGVKPDYYLPRKGHLPGAVLCPFAHLYGDGGAFVDRDGYLARMSRELSGGGQIAAYCEVGVRASSFALLHELYTGQVVSVFDGSLMQCGLESSLPVLRT